MKYIYALGAERNEFRRSFPERNGIKERVLPRTREEGERREPAVFQVAAARETAPVGPDVWTVGARWGRKAAARDPGSSRLMLQVNLETAEAPCSMRRVR